MRIRYSYFTPQTQGFGIGSVKGAGTALTSAESVIYLITRGTLRSSTPMAPVSLHGFRRG